MSEPLDAYHKWLGIPPSEQPPNHYRLLGLQLYEADQEVIAAGAVQRMNWVRKFQKGPQGAVAQKLAQEITLAWACLLNAERKARYDEQFKQHADHASIVASAGNVDGSWSAAASNAVDQPLFDPPKSLPDLEDLQKPPEVSSDGVPVFDPYQKWLAIPPTEQPPNHYRLLGLSLFEADPLAIATAAMQRVDWIQKCQTGPDCAIAKKLTNEISEATEWLLDPQRKAAYDGLLGQQSARQPHGISSDGSLSQHVTQLQPIFMGTAEAPLEAPHVHADEFDFSIRAQKRKRTKRPSKFSLAMYVTSAAIGLFLGYLVLRLLGIDVFHLVDMPPVLKQTTSPVKPQANYFFIPRPQDNSLILKGNIQRTNPEKSIAPPPAEKPKTMPHSSTNDVEREPRAVSIKIAVNLASSAELELDALRQMYAQLFKSFIDQIENACHLDLKSAARILSNVWQSLVEGIHVAHRDAQSLVQQGIALIGAGNGEAALKALDRASQMDGTIAEAEFLLGMQKALIDRNYQIAKYNFAAAFERCPDAASLNNLAVIEVMNNEYASAIHHFRAAIALKPGDSAIAHNIWRVVSEAKLKNLSIAPSVVVAFSTLLEKASAQLQDNNLGWLYLFPDNNQKDEFDYRLLAQNNKLAVDNNYPPKWTEDKVCMACRGTGKVHCPDCQNGTVASTETVPIYRDPA